MINVIVGNSLSRNTTIVPANTTLRSVLESAEVDYTRGGVTLDGSPIQPGGLDKTFADYGVTERCYLLCVVKQDNA